MSVLHIYNVCVQNLVRSKMKEGGIAAVSFAQIAGTFHGTAGMVDYLLCWMTAEPTLSSCSMTCRASLSKSIKWPETLAATDATH